MKLLRRYVYFLTIRVVATYFHYNPWRACKQATCPFFNEQRPEQRHARSIAEKANASPSVPESSSCMLVKHCDRSSIVIIKVSSSIRQHVAHSHHANPREYQHEVSARSHCKHNAIQFPPNLVCESRCDGFLPGVKTRVYIVDCKARQAQEQNLTRFHCKADRPKNLSWHVQLSSKHTVGWADRHRSSTTAAFSQVLRGVLVSFFRAVA